MPDITETVAVATRGDRLPDGRTIATVDIATVNVTYALDDGTTIKGRLDGGGIEVVRTYPSPQGYRQLTFERAVSHCQSLLHIAARDREKVEELFATRPVHEAVARLDDNLVVQSLQAEYITMLLTRLDQQQTFNDKVEVFCEFVDRLRDETLQMAEHGASSTSVFSNTTHRAKLAAAAKLVRPWELGAFVEGFKHAAEAEANGDAYITRS